MMELSLFLKVCMAFFAVIGYLHGLYREFVALAGIVLGLFLITQFDWTLDVILPRSDASVHFWVMALFIILITFFSYQQAPYMFVPGRFRGRRGEVRLPEYQGWQMRLVSAGIGAFNGYLVVGSLWYFMDQFEYPVGSLLTMPTVGSSSAEFVSRLPLVWLQEGNFLMWLVAGLFMMIIIFR